MALKALDDVFDRALLVGAQDAARDGELTGSKVTGPIEVCFLKLRAA